jgi:hypothetical protein
MGAVGLFGLVSPFDRPRDEVLEERRHLGQLEYGGQVRLNGGRFEFGNTHVTSSVPVLKNSGSAAGNINISGVNNLASMNGSISDGANLNQVHLVNAGLLRGHNQVDVSLVNTSAGELRTSASDWARFRGNENVNTGLINNNGGSLSSSLRKRTFRMGPRNLTFGLGGVAAGQSAGHQQGVVIGRKRRRHSVRQG